MILPYKGSDRERRLREKEGSAGDARGQVREGEQKRCNGREKKKRDIRKEEMSKESPMNYFPVFSTYSNQRLRTSHRRNVLASPPSAPVSPRAETTLGARATADRTRPTGLAGNHRDYRNHYTCN